MCCVAGVLRRPGRGEGGGGGEGREVIQGHQINMAVCFGHLVKSDLASVRYCTPVQVTFYKVPEKHGQVYLER